MLVSSHPAFAHNVSSKDALFVQSIDGPAVLAFLYLGAKHMVTGYDHVAFLIGVVFFLTRFRDIMVFVSLFALGHSITLLSGVLLDFGLDSRLVDAAIGLSVVYKAFDNIGGFDRLMGWRPSPRWGVFAFGLIHGLGLSTKLRDLKLPSDGLVTNLLSFNVGIELGQVILLAAILPVILLWRRSAIFNSSAIAINVLLMTVGFVLIGYHMVDYMLGRSLT